MIKHKYVMIRYSVLTESRASWRIGRNVDEEEYRNKLFSEERLRFRYEIFRAITLPSLLKLDSLTTTVFIFTSSVMPGKYQDEIVEMVSPYPWIRVVPLSPQGRLIGKMHKVLLEDIKARKGEVCYATVRLDDDDALSNDFGVRLDKYLDPFFKGYAVSFASGYAGVFSGGEFKRFHQMLQSKIALGLSFIQVYSPEKETPKPTSVFGLGNHTKIDGKVPVILDSRSPAYIRTVHEKSDAYNDKLVRRLTSGDLVGVDRIRSNFFI